MHQGVLKTIVAGDCDKPAARQVDEAKKLVDELSLTTN